MSLWLNKIVVTKIVLIHIGLVGRTTLRTATRTEIDSSFFKYQYTYLRLLMLKRNNDIPE